MLIFTFIFMMGPLQLYALEPSAVESALLSLRTEPAAPSRAQTLSALFLGSPYIESPLGEGSGAQYDQDPLYRFDSFDCTTYVETVIALTFSPDLATFESRINQVRYSQGVVSFFNRNHFVDVDWIPHLVDQGFLQDITSQIAPGRSTVAEALIDKESWYEHMQLTNLNLTQPSTIDTSRILESLRNEGRGLQQQIGTIPYISIDTLFNGCGATLQLDPSFVSNFPDFAIVNFVRPNWDLSQAIGTHLNVSHQGILIKRDGTLFLRHASSSRGVRQVVETPLAEYLANFLNHPTLKGINILRLGTGSRSGRP